MGQIRSRVTSGQGGSQETVTAYKLNTFAEGTRVPGKLQQLCEIDGAGNFRAEIPTFRRAEIPHLLVGRGGRGDFSKFADSLRRRVKSDELPSQTRQNRTPCLSGGNISALWLLLPGPGYQNFPLPTVFLPLPSPPLLPSRVQRTPLTLWHLNINRTPNVETVARFCNSLFSKFSKCVRNIFNGRSARILFLLKIVRVKVFEIFLCII